MPNKPRTRRRGAASAEALALRDLAAEAAALVTLYRQIAGVTPTPADLPTAAFALGRVLGYLDLEGPRSKATLDRASRELAAARVTLARIRQQLGR